MRFSYSWLREWVDIGLTAEQIAERFTSAGLEADSITPLGVGLDGVVVGEIVECQPHPDADRLRVCQVEYGQDEPVTIVCGAPNARIGLKAPLATIGSELPGGFRIKPAKLRGVPSFGMLCSAPELGLGDDKSGLLELPPSSQAGLNIVEALALPDWVIELDLTPNRADCLSMRGIAHELGAIESVHVNQPEIAEVEAVNDRTMDIELIDAVDCPRYVGRVIESIDPQAKTPDWMVQRLERCGLRSLGPIVDVTNYVLLELGQPMHAFDLAQISGGIRVRRASQNEVLTLLDGSEIKADDDMLLIADHEKPLALAGIMGGAGSAVAEQTRDILLESAWFNPTAISGRARRLGLATDSSHRFERGVDPCLQTIAIERATALIVEIAGGRPGPVIDQQDGEYMPQAVDIGLRVVRVNRLLGTTLESVEIENALRRLGMQVESDGQTLIVRPPSRRRDLEIEVDLIEEVARLVGYDHLPSARPGGRLFSQVRSERMTPDRLVRDSLQARGFQEIMTWSFVSEQDLQQLALFESAQPLANPLSVEHAIMRTSLLPGLVKTASANLRHQQSRLRLFEVGHVFKTGDEFNETRRLGLLMTGRRQPENWNESGAETDFFDLKGEVEQLLKLIGHSRKSVEVVPAQRDCLHPGQAAEMKLNGQTIGWLGQLHPAMAATLDIDHRLFVAELELDEIVDRALPGYQAVGRFPAVRRDLALTAPSSKSSICVAPCVST
ncbi:MAG: phenylalanine--tRNA ligase subunit beta [Pseudomonadota bacterium]